jgi:LacI family transcriptional regulator
MAKRPTLKEVAQLANVSPATVSLVVNHSSGGNIAISEETRQRVMAAVQQLEYYPNLAARSLRTSRTQLLALMVHDLTNPFFSVLIREAQLTAEERGFEIMAFDCILDVNREKRIIDSIIRRGVDGLIMVNYGMDPEIVKPVQNAQIPIVTIGPEWPGIDSFCIKEQEATRDMVKYLYQKGRRRIAHLAGEQTLLVGERRMNGYRDGLTEVGLPFRDDQVVHGQFRRSGYEDQMAHLFRTESGYQPPDALVAASDVMAIDAIMMFKRMGLRVPDDVAVTGFDNIPQAEIISPTLTTISTLPKQNGRMTVGMVLDRIEGKVDAEPRRVRLPGEFCLRESA